MKKILLSSAVIFMAALCGCQKEDKHGGNHEKSGETYIETAADLDMKMIFVEGGTFSMGATEEMWDGIFYEDEWPVRSIKIDSFYIGECEVTQLQWEKITGQRNPWMMNGAGDDYPMYTISYEQAQEFCEKLSELSGITYCLPTEAQWEYAARGGRYKEGMKYSGGNNIDEVAWYGEDLYNDGTTHPVKTKKANSLGIYDMSGNVSEWCADWYAYEYDENDTTNPEGPAAGSEHIIRGGHFGASDWMCRVSYRDHAASDYRNGTIGLRVAALIP